MQNIAVNGYQQSQVTHTSLEKLIVLLYERAIALTLQAQDRLQNSDHLTAGTKLLRARNIVSELRNGLDHEQGGDLADNLDRLYMYVHDTLLRAGNEGKAELLEPVIKVLGMLKEGWKQVGKNPESEASIQVHPPRKDSVELVHAAPPNGGQSELSIQV